MVKNSIITALLSAALASGAWAGTRDVQKNGQFFQNVMADHVIPLLEGSAYISHEHFKGPGNTIAGAEVQITWHRNGTRYACSGFPSRNGPYGVFKFEYVGSVRENKTLRLKYPLNKLTRVVDNRIGYELLRYDADSGALTRYWYEKRYWWEMNTGHLQSELPAVTWDLCPDFPSAKSLGARVNEKQTAKFYKALVAQDPGKRVLKPEYEAKAEAVKWLDAGGKQQKRQQRRKDRKDR